MKKYTKCTAQNQMSKNKEPKSVPCCSSIQIPIYSGVPKKKLYSTNIINEVIIFLILRTACNNVGNCKSSALFRNLITKTHSLYITCVRIINIASAIKFEIICM